MLFTISADSEKSLCSLPFDISSALSSVASMSSMAFKMIPRLFSGPERETDDGSLSPAGGRGEDTEG